MKNPAINILGAPIGTVVCYVVILVLNMISLVKVIPIKITLSRYIIKPLIAVALMAAGTVAAYDIFLPAGSKLALILSIGVAVVIYVPAVFVLRIPDEELILSIPGISKLSPVLRKLKLIRTEEK